MPEGDKISKAFYVTIMVGTLVAGTLNNITLKKQDSFTINDRPFFHPFVQTMLMFIAELGCLVAFYINYYANPTFKKNHDQEELEAEANGIKTKNNWWVPALPAVCDITGTCLQMLSMSFMPQSIYVMMRGGAPVITAFLSIIFLKKVLSKAQYLGLSLAVCGITIVGITGFVTTSQQGGYNNLIAGLLCCIGSLFTTGIQFVVEEKVLATNHIHPLKMVGMEGLFGVIYTSIALAVANNIPCDASNVDSCNINGHMEDVSGALSAIFGYKMLLLWIVLNMFSLGLFNFFGMSITKHVSSLARAILLITTTLFVWGYNLTFVDGEHFYVMQLVGFIVLVVGNLIYQRIIKIPALDQTTKGKNSRKGSKSSFGKVSVNDCISHQLLVDEEKSEETLLASQDK